VFATVCADIFELVPENIELAGLVFCVHDEAQKGVTALVQLRYDRTRYAG
jgi:hypothetical protein